MAAAASPTQGPQQRDAARPTDPLPSLMAGKGLPAGFPKGEADRAAGMGIASLMAAIGGFVMLFAGPGILLALFVLWPAAIVLAFIAMREASSAHGSAPPKDPVASLMAGKGLPAGWEQKGSAPQTAVYGLILALFGLVMFVAVAAYLAANAFHD